MQEAGSCTRIWLTAISRAHDPDMQPGNGAAPEKPVRVLIVEDHRMFAEALVRALARVPGLSVVGAVTSATEARRMVQRSRPDVVLLDQVLPDGIGTEVAAAIRAGHPGTRVVIVTGSHDNAHVREAAAAGCSGFVLKTQSVDELVGVVRRAASGEALVPRSVPRELAARIKRTVRQNRLGLTAREVEVLQLIAGGASNPGIAAHLNVSLHTVRNHVQNVIRKCDAHSKLEAVSTALREGVIRTPIRSMPA